MFESLKKTLQILNRKEHSQLFLLLLVIIVNALTQTLGVVSVMPFINLIMDPDIIFENQYLLWAYQNLNFVDLNSFIIFTGLVIFGIIITSNAIAALAAWITIKFTLMTNHRLSLRLLKKYLSMPYTYFLDQHSADLSKNVLSEVGHLTYSYIMPFLQLITKCLMVIFIMAMLIWIDPLVSIVAITLIGGTYAAVFLSIKKKLLQKGELRFEAYKTQFKSVSEAFGGIKEIKVMHSEPFFIEKYRRSSLEQTGHSTWSALVGQLPRFALEGIAFGGIIIFVLALFITRGDAHQVIPLAALFAFAGYRIVPAIQSIFSSFTGIQFHQAVLNRIHADITTAGPTAKHEPATTKTLPAPLPFQHEIELKDISYNYPNAGEPVLKKINLSVKRGTSVGFVGPTGAGKTTLVDIILGLLLPQKGQILIDGIPLDKSNLYNWQRNLGYVPQFIYLSDDTIANNIAFGQSEQDLDLSALIRAAQFANIDNFIITELPQGYDTMIGERGVRLSGGQRQRIGIARALYHNPAILVFDEATSSLDGITEESVLAAIKNAARFKTIVIIAHRITTVENCDLIYFIDKGQIVDQGTYGELLKSNKQFRSMAKARM